MPDVAVLVIGLTATVLLSQEQWRLAFGVACVIGHFFLFCNVLRMSRRLELCWGTIFILLAGCAIRFGTPS